MAKYVTNSLEPGEPNDPEGCSLFAIYSAFAGTAEQAANVGLFNNWMM